VGEGLFKFKVSSGKETKIYLVSGMDQVFRFISMLVL